MVKRGGSWPEMGLNVSEATLRHMEWMLGQDKKAIEFNKRIVKDLQELEKALRDAWNSRGNPANARNFEAAVARARARFARLHADVGEWLKIKKATQAVMYRDVARDLQMAEYWANNLK